MENTKLTERFPISENGWLIQDFNGIHRLVKLTVNKGFLAVWVSFSFPICFPSSTFSFVSLSSCLLYSSRVILFCNFSFSLFSVFELFQLFFSLIEAFLFSLALPLLAQSSSFCSCLRAVRRA